MAPPLEAGLGHVACFDFGTGSTEDTSRSLQRAHAVRTPLSGCGATDLSRWEEAAQASVGWTVGGARPVTPTIQGSSRQQPLGTWMKASKTKWALADPPVDWRTYQAILSLTAIMIICSKSLGLGWFVWKHAGTLVLGVFKFQEVEVFMPSCICRA